MNWRRLMLRKSFLLLAALHKKSGNTSETPLLSQEGPRSVKRALGWFPRENVAVRCMEPPRLLGLRRPRSLPLLTQEGSFCAKLLLAAMLSSTIMFAQQGTPGPFTAQQAQAGQASYQANCAACHQQ